MIHEFHSRTRLLVLLAAVCLANKDTHADTKVPNLAAAQTARPCLLLKNGSVLFGSAQQRGEFVVVRKANGSEIQLKRKDVACWASSLRGLYRYRVDHRHLRGVRAHLDDARWCLRYDLHDQAAKELQAVYRIDPANQPANRLTQQLRRAQDAKLDELTDPTTPTMDAASIQLATHQQPATPEETFDAQTLQRFARHIQPLLLNRCGSCHADDFDRKWKLVLPAFGSRSSARISQANLSATIRYVDTNHPPESEILRRAIDGHAGKSATLGPRANLPTRSLEIWLRNVRPSNLPAGDSPAHEAHKNATEMPAEVQQAAHTDDSGEEEINGPKGITRLPAVTNPFDPELFNRRFHRDQ